MKQRVITNENDATKVCSYLIFVAYNRVTVYFTKIKNILSRQEVATWSSIEETQEYVFSFLWKEPDLDENFERSLAKILDKKNELSFIYKYKSDLLSKIWDELEAKDIPDEFKYFILLNHDQDTIFPIAGDQNKDFIVNEQINEKLNYHKSLDDFIKYSKLLLSNFKEWDLAVMWYFVWSDNLKSLMMAQNQTNFEDLYFPQSVRKILWFDGLCLCVW